jgi:hypothetical protein
MINFAISVSNSVGAPKEKPFSACNFTASKT